MGIGDVLMSMGEARALRAHTGHPVLIVGGDGKPVKDAERLFQGVPYLLTAPIDGPYEKLVNGPGVRPYIAGKTSRKWMWQPYIPLPAELVFTQDELEFAERYRGAVMIEPQVKAIGHENKQWGSKNWTALVALLREAGITTVQCGPGGTLPIADRFALTPGFRCAAAVLSVSRAAVLPEGGLQHAAAAVGTPSVVIWSEFISPDITGYEMHRNLRVAGPPCGMRFNCMSCRKSMAAISPNMMLDTLKEILT